MTRQINTRFVLIVEHCYNHKNVNSFAIDQDAGIVLPVANGKSTFGKIEEK